MKKGPLDNYNRRRIIEVLWEEKYTSAYNIKKLIKSELTLSTIIGHLNVLVEAGFITRIRKDRGAMRRHLYTLTEAGKEEYIKDVKQWIHDVLNSPMEADFRKIWLKVTGKELKVS